MGRSLKRIRVRRTKMPYNWAAHKFDTDGFDPSRNMPPGGFSDPARLERKAKPVVYSLTDAFGQLKITYYFRKE